MRRNLLVGVALATACTAVTLSVSGVQPPKLPAPTPAPVAMIAPPDKLVRTLLGVSSLHARFPVPKDKDWCHLAVVKFQDGKFVGYADTGGFISCFHTQIGRKHFEAELGWAPRNAKPVAALVTKDSSQHVEADDFFEHFPMSHSLAQDYAPTQKLGPFTVLGFAAADSKAAFDLQPVKDVNALIRSQSKIILFLMATFETHDQAKDFVKKLPELSIE